MAEKLHIYKGSILESLFIAFPDLKKRGVPWSYRVVAPLSVDDEMSLFVYIQWGKKVETTECFKLAINTHAWEKV